jgi:hypothetical protein
MASKYDRQPGRTGARMPPMSSRRLLVLLFFACG